MTNLLGQTAVIIAASSAPVEKIKLLVDAEASTSASATPGSGRCSTMRPTDAARTEVLEYLDEKAPESIKAASAAERLVGSLATTHDHDPLGVAGGVVSAAAAHGSGSTALPRMPSRSQ